MLSPTTAIYRSVFSNAVFDPGADGVGSARCNAYNLVQTFITEREIASPSPEFILACYLHNNVPT